MIRVLAVANSLDFGGAERMLEQTVRSLSRGGAVQFTVCSLGSEGVIGHRLRARGVEVIALGAQEARPLSVLSAILAIRRLLRARTFDMLHSFLYRSHFVCRLARLSLGLRPPLVSAEHCSEYSRHPLPPFLNRLLSPLSDRIVAVSEAVRQRLLVKDGVRPARIALIKNGVATPGLRSGAGRRLRKVLGIPPDEVVFLFLGRLHREKGPDLLLRALRLLADRGIGSWKLLMVGEGPERQALERMASDLGLAGRILLPGFRATVGPWLEASDLLVLPSREEGLPVAALEGMSRAKPIVGTNVGGTAEAVEEGRTGLLVPPEDPESLASALERLHRDETLRRAMGEAGRRKVLAEFSLSRMADQTLSCYHRILEESSRRAGTEGNAALAEGAGE